MIIIGAGPELETIHECSENETDYSDISTILYSEADTLSSPSDNNSFKVEKSEIDIHSFDDNLTDSTVLYSRDTSLSFTDTFSNPSTVLYSDIDSSSFSSDNESFHNEEYINNGSDIHS